MVQKSQYPFIEIKKSENVTFDSVNMNYYFLNPVASFNSSENYVQLGVNVNLQTIPSNQYAVINLLYNQHLVSQYASLVQQIFPMFYHTIFTAYVDVNAP